MSILIKNGRVIDPASGRDERLYRVYLARIREYRREPPEDGWDGTVKFTRK